MSLDYLEQSFAPHISVLVDRAGLPEHLDVTLLYGALLFIIVPDIDVEPVILVLRLQGVRCP